MPTQVYTKQELDHLLQKLDHLILNMYSGKRIVSSSQNKAYNLQSVRSQLMRLQEVNINLSGNPSKELLKKIKKWFEQENLKAVLNINVDKDLLGGMTIDYKGKYKDYSLKSKMHV